MAENPNFDTNTIGTLCFTTRCLTGSGLRPELSETVIDIVGSLKGCLLGLEMAAEAVDNFTLCATNLRQSDYPLRVALPTVSHFAMACTTSQC